MFIRIQPVKYARGMNNAATRMYNRVYAENWLYAGAHGAVVPANKREKISSGQ